MLSRHVAGRRTNYSEGLGPLLEEEGTFTIRRSTSIGLLTLELFTLATLYSSNYCNKKNKKPSNK